MINVRLKDTNWFFEGEKVVPRTQTSFRWFGLVYPGPDQDLGKARAWLQRLKSNGFHGGRMFMELESHAEMDHPFWSTRPHVTPWDLTQPVTHKFKLSPAQRQAIDRAVDMHVQEGVVSEWVINATIKESPGYLWDRWDRTVRYWERMQRATMDFLKEIQATNIWVENTNEWECWASSGVLKIIADEDLLAYMARRARQEDYRNMPYGMSAGGGWDINYPVHANPDRWAFSHVNIHSPRHGDWWRVRNQIAHLFRTYNVPVNLNENMYTMTQDQWRYWVIDGHFPNLASKSSRNVNRLKEQAAGCLDSGAGYCLHNMNGVFCDPDLPLDEMESWFAEQWGADPIPRGPFDHIIKQGYNEILLREPDPDGLEHYNEHMMDVLGHGGEPERSLRQSLITSKEYYEKFIEGTDE